MREKDAFKRLNIEIPIDLHCKIKSKAAIRNIDMTEYVTRALTEKILKEEQYD